MKNALIQWVAMGFGSGSSPVAPGTMGSLAAIPLYLLARPLPLGWYGLLVLFMAVAGVWLCGVAAEQMGEHDHPGIVWDEIVGMFIALALVPPTASGLRLAAYVVVGFVLFRVFDILKPWPISWLDQHVPGGLGIMLDDVAAGFVALLGLLLITLLEPSM
ncbi:MAG TPA: phosphatidylglycerophosphatase A [Gammaproteobacteria bacterium]|nr:phosphatidylglycerophosphatase A [Gammaproteobacteria bacterium]